MKQIRTIALLFFLLATCYSYSQTGVIVTYYDGTTQNFNVTTAGKLYFLNNDLNVKIDGASTPTSIPVTIIRKITFSNTLATTTFGENKNNMVLYPNPSSGIIRINSDSYENLNVKIFSLTGQLVKQGVYQPQGDIDISDLSRGLYLVQVNNVTFKFSKK